MNLNELNRSFNFNTIILLIDFEGMSELEDQSYLQRRYISLQNMISDRRIKREDCIIVFNTYDIRLRTDTQMKFFGEFTRMANPTLRAIGKFAWINKWKMIDLNEETEGGYKDIDIETFLKAIRKKVPEFVVNGDTKIIIGGTETAGCCLNNKKLGALHWVQRGYDTTIYLPMTSDYSTQGTTWHEKQEQAFVQFWKTVTSSNLRPDYYTKLSVENDYKSISHKLPMMSNDKIQPL